METRAQRPALRACRQWLVPIARWLLRSGVTWKEFSALARSVFVRVATDEFGVRGRPTNVSRVALLTGLSRRDVRRVRDGDAHGSMASSEQSLNTATRVLSGWHLDVEFLDDRGQPRVLPGKGPGPSLGALLRRYAGDIPTTALVKELVRAGSIERLADGRYRVLRRYYMPRAADAESIERAGHVLSDLATTVEYNLSRRSADPSRFEGRAQSLRVEARQLPAFRAFLEREAQGFLERVDDWLSTHEVDPADRDAVPLRIGAGVYAIHSLPRGENP
jgi:hypothetical protein